MLRVITLDPGKTTGFCIASIFEEEKPTLLTVGQVVMDCADLWNWLQFRQPNIIIYENFTYRPGMLPGLQMYSRNLIGVVQLYFELPTKPVTLDIWPIPELITSDPSVLGGYYRGNDKLRELGVYAAGKEHGRSATKHFLHWHNFKGGLLFNNKLGYELEVV